MAKKARNDQMAAAVSAQIANAYWRKGLYDKAYEFIQKPLRYGAPHERSGVLAIVSDIYEALNKQDSATLFNEEITRIGNVYSKRAAYEDLARHYRVVIYRTTLNQFFAWSMTQTQN